jgi:enamine deaminase RidA (YjgF/YER057c/UK114 family)
MSKITARLSELGVTLPTPPVAAANYLPYTRSGNQVHVAGQLPKLGDTFIKGKLGGTVNPEEGAAAAKMCIINFLAQVQQAAGGNLDRVKTIVKLNVFVASDPSFEAHPLVANGASDFIGEVFGEQGRHARSAVGVAALPFNAAVEIDGIVELHDENSKL